MRITFLGTGGAFTDYRVNYQNNALVHTAEGPVLLDCGVTACQSLRELGVPAADVRGVLFTHLHADHASPEQLAWERFYTGPAGPAYARTALYAPGELLGPLRRSLEPYMDAYAGADGEIQEGGVDALLDLRPTAEVEIGGVRFRWFRVPHVVGATVDKAAYGIEIDDGATRVLWSGDTTLSPGWIRAAAEDPRVARIYHECLFAPRFRGTVHSHFEELAALDPELTRKICLMHHTAVPRGLDLSAFAGAAARHEEHTLGPAGVQVRAPRPPAPPAGLE